MGDISKNFNRSEFACRCGCGFDTIDREVVEICQLIRDKLGRSVLIASGCRCEQHNKHVGGAPSSAHVTGHAVDVACVDGRTRYLIMELLIKRGVTRIGLHKKFIHFDVSPHNVPEVIWFY